MFCSHCGVQVAPHANYCPSCGGVQPGNVSNRRIMRPLVGRKAGGVCLGIATYLNVDVTLIRVIAVLVFFFGGTGAMLYVICWFVMPSEEFVPPAAAPQTPPPAPAQPQGQ